MFRLRPIERAWRKICRRSDQLGTPQLCQHAIERAGIRLFVGDRPAGRAA